ncbi:MAG TPA: DUF448 domain-containing protein [Sphingomicrobium sp.]|nr:DUF448 domain-containing protein [Sphingomicrobium sp.]
MRNPRNDGARVNTCTPAKAGAQERVSAASHRRGPRPSPGNSPERTCILTRRKGTKDQLIRLALGPDGSVAPDARSRAPGRGAWIGVSRADLDAANAKGKLKPALSRAYKRNDVSVPADLGARIEAALRQTALDRLGMEARAGNLVNGAERVETAARSGKVHLLIHAADSGEDGRRALDQAWRVGGGGPQGMIFPEGRTILSMALGRENVVHVALTDPAAASRVAHALARWRAFTGPERGPEGGEPASGTGSAEADLTKD